MKLPELNYAELFCLALFSIIGFWPWVRDIWSPHTKQIEEDMKGDNSRWDFYELWERQSLRIGRGGWVAVWTMLIMTTLFNKEYPIWLWAFFFTSTLGTAGIAAYMMKIRSQFDFPKNENEKK